MRLMPQHWQSDRTRDLVEGPGSSRGHLRSSHILSLWRRRRLLRRRAGDLPSLAVETGDKEIWGYSMNKNRKALVEYEEVFFFLGWQEENHRITPVVQGGAASSVRLLLIKNPARSLTRSYQEVLLLFCVSVSSVSSKPIDVN